MNNSFKLFSRTRIEGTKKRSYTEEELGKALNDIKSGRLGTRRAAALYNIPRSTLRNKVHKMNSGDKKMRSIDNTARLISELNRNEDTKSTSDQSPATDSLRELLKRNLCSKGVNESSDRNSSSNLASTSGLDNLQSSLPNLDIEQFLNLTTLNSNFNAAGLNGSLNSLNSNNLISQGLMNNGYLDNNLMNNNNLLSNALTYQFLNQQTTNLETWINLMKLQLHLMNNKTSSTFGGKSLDVNGNVLNDPLDESINSVQSNNSAASGALRLNLGGQLINHSLNNHNHNDEDTRSTLDDKLRMHQLINLEQSNDGQNSDESNASLIELDDEKERNQDLITGEKSSNLNESLNSNNSLNLNNNHLLLNLISNPLNQLGLANLTGNLNNLSNLSNLNNLNNFNNLQLNLPVDHQRKNQPHSGKQQMPIEKPKIQLINFAFSSIPDDAQATNASNNTAVDPNRKRPKRGRYRNYKKMDLDLAVKAVQNGEMSVHRAGTLFGVPHSTLEYKVSCLTQLTRFIEY